MDGFIPKTILAPARRIALDKNDLRPRVDLVEGPGVESPSPDLKCGASARWEQECRLYECEGSDPSTEDVGGVDVTNGNDGAVVEKKGGMESEHGMEGMKCKGDDVA